MQDVHLLSGRKVDAQRNRGRSSRYNDIDAGLLTKPVRCSTANVGWPDYEIRALACARIAGLDDDAIRELVDRLHSLRVAATVLDDAAIRALLNELHTRHKVAA